MAYLYLIDASCPHCDGRSMFGESRDHPVPVDQDVEFHKPHCPQCGYRVHTDGGEWDVYEEVRVARAEVVEEGAVELAEDDVEGVLEDLEGAMGHAETSLSHEEVRPSTFLLAEGVKDAYRTLVEAHPAYRHVEGAEVVEE